MNNQNKIFVKALEDVYYRDSIINDKGNIEVKNFKQNKGNTFYVSKKIYELLSIPKKDKSGKVIENSGRVKLEEVSIKEDPIAVNNVIKETEGEKPSTLIPKNLKNSKQ